jgi:hypothetical protein
MAATQPAPSVARVAPDLPVEAVALIDKALQWDPRNRHQTALEMGQAVDALLNQLDQPEDQEPVDDDMVMELDLDDGSMPSATGASEVARASYPATRVVRTEGEPTIELDGEFRRGDLSVRPAPIGLRRASEIRRGTRTGASEGSMPPTTMPPTLGGLSLHSAGGGSDEVPLPSGHPLLPMLVTLDRLLRTARQYGPSHPETQSRLLPVFVATADALTSLPEGIHFRVLPFCFTRGDETVWEPSPPGDLVPYTLSVAGVRELHIFPGVEEAELRELLGAMMIDANTNPSDIATARRVVGGILL